MMESMLANLNAEQKAAVMAVDDGPVLVTAGAGTGKTTVARIIGRMLLPTRLQMK